MAAESNNPTRIMVAVNESNVRGYPNASMSSRGAFDWTLRKIIRSNINGFKLLLLHVQVPDIGGYEDVDNVWISPADFNTVQYREHIRGLHLLEYFVKQCYEIGVACEAWVRFGDPKEVICYEAKRVQADFVVVGSRGLGPFQTVFVGGISEFIVKHAECPVIAIKRSAAQTPVDPAED